MSALLQSQLQEGILHLQLQRPDAYNALSLELMDTLLNTLQQQMDNPDLRVVVISGSGRGFCAGHDLRQLTAQDEPAYHQQTFNRCAELMQAIVNFPLPVIASVHGVATAAGCQLVASCDLAICADSARFATPGVNIGLFCSTPMVALSRSLQSKHAMELLLTGELIDAERAAMMGLVNWVVAEAELASATQAKAALIAGKSRATLQLGKAAYRRQQALPLAQAYQLCSQTMVENLQLADAKEGIDAFLHKRPPQWQHR